MDKSNRKRAFILLFAFLILSMSISVYADMIWPSAIIEQNMLAWWVIAAGLVIEFIFVKVFTKDSVVKSIIMTLAMNAGSAIIGIIFIPWTGFLGEFVLVPLDMLFKTYTFSLFHWIFAFLLAVLCNVLIEGLILKFIFKKKFKKIFFWLAAANFLSVIICMVNMFDIFK